MGRLLALDFGKKRTGIAVSDPMQLIATGLQTVETHQLLIFLENYFKTEIVDKVIIGMPKNLDNSDTDATKLVTDFIKKFKQLFSHKRIETIDERFTSKIAQQTILQNGLKKKDRQNKALVDEISAIIILQDYMLQNS